MKFIGASTFVKFIGARKREADLMDRVPELWRAILAQIKSREKLIDFIAHAVCLSGMFGTSVDVTTRPVIYFASGLCQNGVPSLRCSWHVRLTSKMSLPCWHHFGTNHILFI